MMCPVVVTGLGRRVASRSHLVATLQQPAAIAPLAGRVRLRNGQQHHQHRYQHQQRRHASDHARRPKTALFFPGAACPPWPILPPLPAMSRPPVLIRLEILSVPRY